MGPSPFYCNLADHSVSIQVLPSPVLLEGSKLTLLCDAYPSEVAGSSNFTWTKNKQPLTQKSYQRNSLQNEITLKSVSISDSGKYTCIYQTSTGKTFTAFVFIKVEGNCGTFYIAGIVTILLPFSPSKNSIEG